MTTHATTSTTTAPQGASAQRTRTLLALAALALPTLLVAVDIAVLQVALPTMGRDLHASATELLWMTDSYNFLVAGAMLTTGAIADRIGRRRMILVCAAIFAVASGVGAFATTPELVIVARGVMGLAGSAIMPASMALLGGLFTEEKARIQAMGAMMTVFLGGMAVAPFIGGLLLAHFWWGSVFLMGVPVMAVTIALVPRLIPESKAEVPAPLDLTSAGLSVVTVLSLVFALKRAVNTGLDPAVVGHGRGRRRPRYGVPAPPAPPGAPLGRPRAAGPPARAAYPARAVPDRGADGGHLAVLQPLPPGGAGPVRAGSRLVDAAADGRDDRLGQPRPLAEPAPPAAAPWSCRCSR